MKVLITTKLSQHKYKTPEGYLVCQDAILARTGTQEYYKSEVYENFEGEDEPIIVYRNPEQVFDEKTMASFEDKPITIEHPVESVNPENYRDLAVGHTRNVRKGRFNNQDVMIADLIITDAQTIADIEAGIRTDLSCGYNCDITAGDKPEQINIRGNHVALCEQGRAGIARIIDSKPTKVKDKNPDRNLPDDKYFAGTYRGYDIYENGDEYSVFKGDKLVIEKTDDYKEDINELFNGKVKYTYNVTWTDKSGTTFNSEITATSEDEARNIALKTKPNINTVAGITLADSNNSLPIADKNKLSRYLRFISKHVSNDIDISEIIEPIKAMGFNPVREDIKGWYQLPDGYYRKDYLFRVDNYDDIFMVSLYAKGNGDWTVNEVNAYFTGKQKVEDEKPIKKNCGNLTKYIVFNDNGKLKGTSYNNYYKYHNKDKFDDYSDFSSVESVTEYLMDNKDVRRENIVVINDAYGYKKPASINKNKIKELNKQLKKINSGKDEDSDKQESINHQKRKIRQKIVNQIKEVEKDVNAEAEKGLDTNIRLWYSANIDIDNKVDTKVTFRDLFNTLDNLESVIELLGDVDETVIRNCFKKLSDLTNIPYKEILKRWHMCKA